MTEMTEMKPLPRGTWVRTTRALSAPEWHESYRKGYEFEVEEFNDPNDPEDGWDTSDEGMIQVAFYYGNADGGCNNVEVPADAVEVVMTAAAARSRQVPPADEVAKAVARGLMDEDDFSVHSVDFGEWNPETFTLSATFEARTHEGLEFGGEFEVRMRALGKSD